MKLAGKVAIVAGGGQGIGEGIARCLAEEGADISVLDIKKDTAARVSEEVRVLSRRSLAVTADLTVKEEVDKAVEETADFFGHIDILINNVGGSSPETARLIEQQSSSLDPSLGLPEFMNFSQDAWDQYYRLNLKSHVLLSSAVTPYFVRQKSGKIVNISSISGRLAESSHIPYATMKAADVSLTWSLAQGLARHNVNVNCICPGLIWTPLWERGAADALEKTKAAVKVFNERGEKLPRSLARFTDADLENMAPRDFWLRFYVRPANPMGREQTAADIGRAVVFLVSDDARNITGQVLNVDCGQVMR